jgi:hypothetical protein
MYRTGFIKDDVTPRISLRDRELFGEPRYASPIQIIQAQIGFKKTWGYHHRTYCRLALPSKSALWLDSHTGTGTTKRRERPFGFSILTHTPSFGTFYLFASLGARSSPSRASAILWKPFVRTWGPGTKHAPCPTTKYKCSKSTQTRCHVYPTNPSPV